MEIAKSTDWKTEELPLKKISIPLDRSFSQQEMELIPKGLVPQEMEDKWFIYWKDETLFFHRSWTGFCLYVVYFVKEEDGFGMKSADVNRDPEQYEQTDDEYDARMIQYLVDLLLLHRDAIFPVDEASPEKKALMNWSLVGRAMLGPDAKYTGIRIIKKGQGNKKKNPKDP